MKRLVQLKLRQTISKISSWFAEMRDVDRAIELSLAEIGTLSDADRVGIFLINVDRETADKRYEWCAEGVASQLGHLKGLPLAAFPWWMNKLANNETVLLSDVSGMPDEAGPERQLIQSEGTTSLVAIPLTVKGELGGFVSLSNALEAASWTEEEVETLLRLFSEILSSAFERKWAEDKLNDWAQFARNNPNPVLELDCDCVINAANPAAERLFGETDIVGSRLCEHCPEVTSLLEMISCGDNTLEQELRIGDRFCLFSFVGSEKSEKVFAYGLDVTERKQAEAELRKLSRAVEHSPASVVVTALDGTIEYVNPMFTEVTGYSFEEAMGQNPRILKSGNLSKTHYETLWSTILAGDIWRGEFINKKKDGEEYWETASISPIFDADGNVTHFVAVKEDITEQKRVEDALKLNHERLQSLLTLNQLDDPSEALLINFALEEVVRLTESEIGYFHLVNPSEKTLQLSTWSDATLEHCTADSSHEYPLAQAGVWADSVRQRRPVVHNDYPKLTDKKGLPEGHTHIVRHATVPVFDDDVIVAVVGVGNKPCRYEQSDIDQLTLYMNSTWQILKRRRVEAALRESQTTLAEAQRIAHVGNWDWHIVDNTLTWSDEIYRIFGLQPQVFKGTFEAFLDRVHPEDREKVELAATEALNGKAPYDIEHRIVRSDGEERFVHERAEVFRDDFDQPIRMVGTVQDVTTHKQVEKDLERASRLADEANQAKGDFLARMSHEIRTPMNAIMGMGHLLSQTNISTKQANYIGKINSASRNLLRIINDILDFSKIEAGKLEIETVEYNLDDVFSDLANLVGIEAEQKGLELIFNIAPNIPNQLLGDPLRLSQVLVNLTNNAIKFTDSGQVEVKAELRERKGNHLALHFAVRDTGIGLSEEQMSRLFVAFSQADRATTRRFGGTGLGLAICKRLVEMMGGEICVESVLNQGSTFHFTLNVLFRTEHQIPLRLPTGVNRKLRVLVAEANPVTQNVLGSYLAAFLCDTEIATSSEQTLVELRAGLTTGHDPFDLVLLDHESSGATVREIVSDPEIAHKPKIVLLAGTSEEDRLRKEKQRSWDAILVKPVIQSCLHDILVDLFGKHATGSPKAISERAPSAENFATIDGARVLLVEDNAINRWIATELLEGKNVNLIVAHDGRMALELLTQQPDIELDAVLMDLHMPHLDGYEATRKIRSIGHYVGLPIIAMTADAMPGIRENCLAAGMSDYVTKPINPYELFSTLSKWIGPTKPAHAFTDAPAIRKEQPVVKLPTLPGIDTTLGLAGIDGNVRLFERLLERFVADHKNAAQDLKLAFDNGDREQAVLLAHTIKGAAGQLGAVALCRASKNLESALKNHDDEAIPSLMDAFAQKLSEVNQGIEQHWPKTRPNETRSSRTPTDISTATLGTTRALLEKFAQLLGEDDIEAIACLEEIEQQLTIPEIAADLVVIKKMMGNYDFQSALSVLVEMMEKRNLTPTADGDD